eukprot:3234002-Rhodomonas_salina.2
MLYAAERPSHFACDRGYQVNGRVNNSLSAKSGGAMLANSKCTCSCGLHEPPLRAQAVSHVAPEIHRRPELTDEVLAEMQATRRHLHANPELSFFEKDTAALVAARLRALPGYEVTEGIAP